MVRAKPGFEVNVPANWRETSNAKDAEHGLMLWSAVRW